MQDQAQQHSPTRQDSSRPDLQEAQMGSAPASRQDNGGTASIESIPATGAALKLPTPEGQVVVLDTSAIIHDPDIFDSIPGVHLIIPLVVVEELDNLKTRQDHVGHAARKAVRRLEKARLDGDGTLSTPVATTGGGDLRIELNHLALAEVAEAGLDVTKNDNRIIAAALGQARAQQEAGLEIDVVVVSNDAAVRVKSARFGLRAREYDTAGPRASLDGWYSREVAYSLLDRIHSEKRVEVSDLEEEELEGIAGMHTNEFLLARSGTSSAIVRLEKEGKILRKVHSSQPWGLKPLNNEQRFALDLLMDPAISVVALHGPAGTGKTALALSALLEQTFETTSPHCRFERILILRSMSAVGGEEIGFLPGDVRQKTGEAFKSVHDTLVALGDDVSYAQASQLIEGWVADEKLSLEPVTFLRGRSLQKTAVLVDEAQNLSPSAVKTICTRIGAGSKLVLLGDVSQIDAPFLSAHSNGLSVLIDRFTRQDIFGHIRLVKGQRSELADLAANLL